MTQQLSSCPRPGLTLGYATQTPTEVMPKPAAIEVEKNIGAVMIANGTGGHLLEQAIKSKLFELWFGIDDQSQAQLDVGLAAQKRDLEQLKSETHAPDEAWMTQFLGDQESIGPPHSIRRQERVALLRSTTARR